MSDIAIRIYDLSKEYRIGAQPQNYHTLRDTIAETAMAPFYRIRSMFGHRHAGALNGDNTIMALKDICFEVTRGEVLAVIGRNGAGKSTLLKILSRITEPTSGYVEIHGRVGSLLEVGTGFHSELTGRENIYLSGAILGMKKAEINRKFDEIVAFAETEKFIDTPVKHYSSGMYLRLAFAVAAHLDPEILLVDEVLAVGDAMFQKKCLGKMKDVAQQGRTVLFVSHNMTAVQAFCPRAVLLRQGALALDSQTDEVVRNYLSYLNNTADHAFENNPERNGQGGVRFTRARILDEAGSPTRALVAGKPATLELYYENPAKLKQARIFVTVYNHLGVAVTSFDTVLTEYLVEKLNNTGMFVCHIPCVPFPIGQYRIAIAAEKNGQNLDVIPNAIVFDVKGSVFFQTSRSPSLNHCACMVTHQWRHETTGQ
jgi:lipopolysaccharide transport system ATP-binding protein